MVIHTKIWDDLVFLVCWTCDLIRVAHGGTNWLTFKQAKRWRVELEMNTALDALISDAWPALLVFALLACAFYRIIRL